MQNIRHTTLYSSFIVINQNVFAAAYQITYFRCHEQPY